MIKYLLIFLVLGLNVKGLTQDYCDYLIWDTNYKLSIDDFGIKTSDSLYSSFALIKLEYDLDFFDRLSFPLLKLAYDIDLFNKFSENLNKKVKNVFIKSTSWINTTKNTDISLRYQQTCFDISEIYARQFRKELKEEQRLTNNSAKRMYELMLVKYKVRCVQYIAATNYGKDNEQQNVWEQQINQELSELNDFAYDN